ncbi:IS4-like element ISVsa5 family transposase [Escherichia coli]|uniref:IS4-like element ISVsa5 family transposase n=2 Tax=Escherichia coli TaxID=562 RepID=UPI001BD00E13|nr:IS4-like element ISVsa5 family transposase [Escherichia coli]MCY0741933.1 IS4-like element ISVsa5 family transposase [Escherichia coli]MCY0743118.1 IS4-like element ISVsa5 family transposase [Escherichia coli]MCY0743566.1 IS4-like element ISVsa5 family transposase [Escherichia coli]MCY0743726.1 IS4-like element ISVsa5 family transposase [Escherichia coli]QVK41679.1 IS4-like element ISVsa5 family transposase [Escherichia coli]
MCELDILHDSLYQFCPELHLKRLNSLTLACHALLDCKTLTLTELGRNLPTKARTKHNIKRIDRLLGNRHLHKERLAVYRWHASFICSGNTMPIVLVDWSDIREQKRLMVLRASVALHGRSVTLYEKAFPLSEQCSKKAHDQFLADLASILPSNTTPLIVSDAGFKVPWYKSVEKLGWYWLSRVRGKVQYADLGAENWKPISNLHDMSSSHSKTLGYKRLTKSNPISCQILLYKSRSKGRKNQRSTRTHCHHPSPKIYSASAKEPWVLATNLPVEIRTPKQLVNIYSKRMQIEETFRDLKSPAYGLGLRHSRTSSSERFDIMLLIALMLQLTCWLAGVHAQKQGWDKHFQANTVRNRNVLSTVRLGMEVLLHSGYTITREDLLVAATLLAQNLFTHGYALGKL